VCGAGAAGPVRETSPLTGDQDASPRNFIAAERAAAIGDASAALGLIAPGMKDIYE